MAGKMEWRTGSGALHKKGWGDEARKKAAESRKASSKDESRKQKRRIAYRNMMNERTGPG